MAEYIIGDIHGCYKTFRTLLEEVSFSKKHDHLYLVGDIVNTGPNSLKALRWCYDNQDVVTTVLGNHDLHLIACELGVKEVEEDDTFVDVLDSKSSTVYVEWLREQAVLVEHEKFMMLHAGLHPSWTKEESLLQAKKIGECIKGEACSEFLKEYYADRQEMLVESDLAQALFSFTSLRYFDAEGNFDLENKEAPEDVSDKLTPWYEKVPSSDEFKQLYFGHWSRLGYFEHKQATCVDSRCARGGSLTAVRIDDKKVFQVEYCG